jgi:hypothetical protein
MTEPACGATWHLRQALITAAAKAARLAGAASGKKAGKKKTKNQKPT